MYLTANALMVQALLIACLFALSACGGGDDNASELDGTIGLPDSFTLQNIRFNSFDYYEGEQITVTRGTDFEVQWVAPHSESYRIDMYLSANGQAYSDTNKVVGLKCGGASLSLCPDATGQVQCGIDNNTLSCSVGSDFIGSRVFLDKDIETLKLIIKGCDVYSNCDVNTFDLLVQNADD